jgi:hypothetical protein
MSATPSFEFLGSFDGNGASTLRVCHSIFSKTNKSEVFDNILMVYTRHRSSSATPYSSYSVDEEPRSSAMDRYCESSNDPVNARMLCIDRTSSAYHAVEVAQLRIELFDVAMNRLLSRGDGDRPT